MKKSNIDTLENGISLSIKENTLTTTGITLVLKNEKDIEIQYGEPYEIEIKKDNQ